MQDTDSYQEKAELVTEMTGIEGGKLVKFGAYLDFKQGNSNQTDPVDSTNTETQDSEQADTSESDAADISDSEQPQMDETVYYCGSDEPNTNATSLDEAVSHECMPA